MKFIIGFVGENGSGKSSFAKGIIEEFGEDSCQTMRFSDILSETLQLWGIPKTRENQQKLPQIMDQAYGAGSLTRAVKLRLDSLTKDIIVVDGVRWVYDEELIRSYEHNFLVYVTASQETRYNRLKNRAEKIDEQSLSKAAFLRQDMAPNEVYIPQIGQRANLKIVNEFSPANLKQEIKILAGLLKTVLP